MPLGTPSGGKTAPATSSTRPRAVSRYGSGWPREIHSMVLGLGIPSRDERGDEHRRIAEPDDGVVHAGDHLAERRVGLARRPERGHRQGRDGRGACALAGGVGERQPRAPSRPRRSRTSRRPRRTPAAPFPPARRPGCRRSAAGAGPAAARRRRSKRCRCRAVLTRSVYRIDSSSAGAARAARVSSCPSGSPWTRNTAIARCRSQSGTILPIPRAASDSSSATRWPVGISGPAICAIGSSSGSGKAPASRRSATPSRSTT